MAETFQPLNPVADAAQDGPPATREPLWRDALGERLRATRHERGETLSETADRAGISPQYLSEIERGLKEPSSEMIAAVAGALETTLGDLARSIAEQLLFQGALRRRAGRERAGRTEPERTAVEEPAPNDAAELDEAVFEGAAVDGAVLEGAASLDKASVERAEAQSGPTCQVAYALAA
ncbi:helix-turn-helix domain-containing protein [Glycomyces sp. NRRL B-16210]|uniref:helix-turn-helix domain-containing protein n=1 Tax=Glycomyces sp. NRRL B-16210 TaxID=1463821 RepID=UPI0009DF1A11|nr:helix-turn-helix transcriptional regulator [Glycomyces sp. NRRL B-16210]